MAVTILIYSWCGEKKIITFSDDENPFETATVEDLKDRVCRLCGNPVASRENIRLIFQDMLLEDKTLLSEYGIQHMSVVHTVIRLAGGGGGNVTQGMGERAGRNASKDQLSDFDATDTEESSCCIL